MNLNKILYIKASFKPIIEEVTRDVETGESKKVLLGFERKITKPVTSLEQTGSSLSEIDGEKLANDIESAVQKLNHEGYEVITVTPVISGAFDYEQQKGGYNTGGSGYGYGYSYTEGVTIVARRVDRQGAFDHLSAL